MAALAELIDHLGARSFLLITAPTTGGAAQGDCDCACPVAPPPAASHALPAGVALRLHPHVRFLVLAADEHLLYIPSALSGVVVNSNLRALLLALARPA